MSTLSCGRPSMRAFAIAWIVFLFCSTSAFGDAVYDYEGEPFTTADPPYSVGDRVTGSITLAIRLPSDLPLTDVTSLLRDFEFSDGVRSRLPANSNVCEFMVATDAAGNITDWSFFLREAPFPGSGNPVETLDSRGPTAPGGDVVGEGPAQSSPCGVIALSASASSGSAGTWDNSLAGPPVQIDYTYTGAAFTSADPPYSVGDQILGNISLAGPLPPFLPLTDIAPALADFTFSDGVQVRTPGNTNVCKFQVATDGAGQITGWSIFIREAPFPGSGNPVQTLDSNSNPAGDLVGEGPAASTPCGSIPLATVASSDTAGEWTSAAVGPSTPTTYDYTGVPFDSADPPYAIGSRVTGSITLAGPLPPLMALTDISAAIEDFAFTDSVQVRAPNDTNVCRFEVATDAAGRIVNWNLSLREGPFPGDGNPVQTLDSRGPIPGPGGDLAGQGPAQLSPCSLVVLGISASSSSPGSWQLRLEASPVHVPSTTEFGLGALVAMFLLFGCFSLYLRD